MPAKEFSCRVTQLIWLTPSVFSIRFEPTKRVAFDAGQFLSIIVPAGTAQNPGKQRLRRIYSFASPREQGYELCVKVTGGPGPAFLSSLRPGDTFRASAPYGHMTWVTKPDRHACFISTGTGLAPFRAMMLSNEFADNPPASATTLFGARNADEIIYPGEFEKVGVREVYALSRPAPLSTPPRWAPGRAPGEIFQGRVTDYLASLPADWNWHTTDFYLCGNGDMVGEVRRHLRQGRGVEISAIHQEVYFANGKTAAPAAFAQNDGAADDEDGSVAA